MKKIGKVFLVGSGPGHPGLITVRGIECVRQADVVIYDYLSNPVFLRSAKPSAQLVYAGKKAGFHTLRQAQIERLMVRHARAGKNVVRLKGGDPFLFGRGGEEALALRKNLIPFEIVPGVSAGIAVPAYAGIPVTHRGCASAVAMITGHEDPEKFAGSGDQNSKSSAVDYANLALFKGTLVFFMGAERVGKIASELIRHGKKPSTPVALIRWGTLGRQQTVGGRLNNIASIVKRKKFAPPALIVVGEVTRFRKQLNWFEQLPLFGKKIVVTRTRSQAGDLSHQLEQLGADVLELPTIEILPPKNFKPLRKAIARIGQYQWLIFTSPNGVDIFFDEFFKKYSDIRKIGQVRLGAIGPATAAKLEERGLKTDLMPREYVSEQIIAEMKKQKGRGRVLLARADIARDALPKGLEKIGFKVDQVIAYRTVSPKNRKMANDLFKRGADLITFTSSSTVENFVNVIDKNRIKKIPGHPQFASIGPITSQTMRKLGLKVASEAKIHTIIGLVEAVLKLLK